MQREALTSVSELQLEVALVKLRDLLACSEGCVRATGVSN